LILPGTIRTLFHSPRLRALRRGVRNEQEGALLVEFAISFLVLLLLIFMVIETAWGVYSFHYLANAAHQATRYASVRGADWGVSCSNYSSSACTASAANIRNYVANRGFPGINITASDVYVSYYSSVQTSASASCSDGSTTPLSSGAIVQVTICYPFALALPGLPNHTWYMSSTSQMVISQ
jgi:Flp pilus assembly protein TadG